MKTWRLAALFIAAFVMALAALIPMSAALSWSGASRAGLSAASVEGTVWRGVLRDAHLRGFPVGDVEAGLNPLALLGGTARLGLSAQDREGVLLGGGTRGFEDASLGIGLEYLGLDLPFPGGLTLLNASVVFAGDACLRAGGTVSTDLLSRGFGGPVMSGELACADGAAVSTLTADGTVSNLRITGDGVFEVTTRIQSADPAIESAAALAGFSRQGAALVRTDTGRAGF